MTWQYQGALREKFTGDLNQLNLSQIAIREALGERISRSQTEANIEALDAFIKASAPVYGYGTEQKEVGEALGGVVRAVQKLLRLSRDSIKIVAIKENTEAHLKEARAHLKEIGVSI